MLKYVQNKDVFMRYHKAHLTRRLILDISADSEIEENMVEWLRVRSVGRSEERRDRRTDFNPASCSLPGGGNAS